MKKYKRFNRLFAILAIILIVFQSSPLLIMAADPWTGSTWKGDTWEGNTWKNKTWTGTEWDGQDWNGQDWQGNSKAGGETWNGSTWEGSKGSNTPWVVPPHKTTPSGGEGGNEWNSNPFNGNSWNNSPYNQDPFNLNPYVNPYGNTPGVNGVQPGVNPSINEPIDQGETEQKDVDPYEVGKYIGDTVINGQVKMVAEAVKDPDKFNTTFPTRTNYLTRVAASGFKLGTDGSLPADMLTYGHDGVDKFFDVKNSLDDLRKISADRAAASSAGSIAATAVEEVAGSTSALQRMSPLSKLNVATAGISAGFAAVDTYKAYESLKTAKTGTEKGEAVGDMMAGGGDFLMSTGAIMAAIPIPAVQAVGAGIVVAGGVLWAAGTATKLVSRHWNKIKGAATSFVKWRENTKKKIVSGGVKLLKAGIKSLFSR